jgi:uncharacterized protein
MIWVITCETRPNMGAVREKAAAAHRAYMLAQKPVLVLAGATRSDDGEVINGSLFLLNVGSRAEAQGFLDREPYMQAGLFTNVTIKRMTKGQWNPESAASA